MCAQIFLKVKTQRISQRFGIPISENHELELYEKIVHGYLKTETSPVIVFSEGKLQVKEMYFSLCPPWSKEFPCAWSTYNARMQRDRIDAKSKKITSEPIYSIPTWKIPFTKGQTCLVPISGAIESSYFGTHAGNIVRFSDQKEDVFYALGIWSEWVDPKTGEVKETYALLTDDPYEFFFKTGHDRSIIVIDESQIEPWLTDFKMPPKKRFDFIREHRVDRDWAVHVERPMKAGWEKRAPSPEEIAQMAVWKP